MLAIFCRPDAGCQGRRSLRGGLRLHAAGGRVWGLSVPERQNRRDSLARPRVPARGQVGLRATGRCGPRSPSPNRRPAFSPGVRDRAGLWVWNCCREHQKGRWRRASGIEGVMMTTARDIMHAGAECIGEHQTLQSAAQRMRRGPAIPITRSTISSLPTPPVTAPSQPALRPLRTMCGRLPPSLVSTSPFTS